ncbi:hypothetical protein EDC04DRAFT_1586944 [Pisolithus marmoratus]|nr:hypothetical protein EDC04DRAFT_1586944 [Pisolithus marmoratus]
MLQEIEALRTKLDETKDEDDQRALEEDVTGKILWLCWCGICAEVDQLLPKVVDYIRSEGDMKGLREIFLVRPSIAPSDDQAHLQRIMRDAGTGTSKYQLLLTARAAEQAMHSQGITQSTTTQRPSTSVV